MSDWQNTTSYRHGNGPLTYTLALKNVRILVHQIDRMGDRWFFTCCELGLSSIGLYCEDLSLAKTKAVGHVKRLLENALADVVMWEREAEK